MAATLSLDLSKDRVEMGKSVTAKFTYTGTQKPELIDLELWHDNFYIEQSDPELVINRDKTIISTTKAHLYPRHTGDITLDAIALGGSFVKPQHIHVMPSVRNKIDATPQIGTLKRHYWADESIIININVPLHYARNEVIAKEWLIDGFNITPLDSIKTDTQIQLRWQIVTPLKGEYHLEPPTIIQRGRGRFRFHLPKIAFTIKPLPAYLPSSVATGLISISSQLIKIKDQTHLKIRLQKDGYLPNEIEGIQALINQLSHAESSLTTQTSNKIENEINTHDITITLPQWIWFKRFNLKLHYFNPQTGQVDSINHSLPRINTVPKAIQQSIVFFLIFGVLFFLKTLNKKSQQWNKLKKLKQQIHHAQNAHSIRAILLSHQQRKTLQEWAETIGTEEAERIKNLLNQACFQGKVNNDLKNIKSILSSNALFRLKDF